MSEYTSDIDRSQAAFWYNDDTDVGLVDEIWDERKRQIEKGYPHWSDDRAGAGTLIDMARRLQGDESTRKHLIQAIALLVAAVEVMDREAE